MAILVNEEEIGRLPGGAPNEKLFDLRASGEYQIRFRLDGCRSAPYTVRIGDGERVTLMARLPENPLLAQVFSRSSFGLLVTERQLPEKIS